MVDISQQCPQCHNRDEDTLLRGDALETNTRKAGERSDDITCTKCGKVYRPNSRDLPS